MATQTSIRPALLDSHAEKLRRVHSIPALVSYLNEELGWPIHVDDWEDAVYNWEPEELNLKAEHQVAVKSIMQLKPLVTGQPWGIFFVDFDKGKLPIVVLRRVLNALAVKRRVKGGGHQTWLARDLLFVSSFGEAGAREIALAHFTDESDVGDLPTLRVLGWDDDDTPRELGYVAQTLKSKLHWPAKLSNVATKAEHDAWRTQWASAFSLKYRQVINDSKSLALALAELAKRIRGRVNTVLKLESANGHLTQLHKAFKENLIADLSADGFADMFAQTITYGLFTARASRESGALVADNLSDMVPSTNPFLKELLADFLNAAGRDRKKSKRVDFDELGINEVVSTLREVPMDAVLRSFNASKPGDDPVIHFYEDFLKAYDKAMRAKRGVFYTPSPVVQFIVRSVDEILKTEFGIEDGLASTITWGEMMARKPELKLPKFCTAATPFVQVLDPATGTGTFIVEVITQIHAHMLGKWRTQGKLTKAQWQPMWVEYVKHHLLPRLYAFELMMAPYAIAHMKIGLKLAETGYTFPEDGPRVNVFLTNALEPAHAINPGLAFEAPMLAHEAAAANRVKEQLAATVVVGNPPYSKSSQNKGLWIVQQMERYKRTVRTAETQIQALSDDYVKFFCLSQLSLKAASVGVLGLITNNGYLDGPIFTDMRSELRGDFPKIDIVNLRGDSRKSADAPSGVANENVFDIQQGVSIFLGSTIGSEACRYRDVWGDRVTKLGILSGGMKGGETLELPTRGGSFFSPLVTDVEDVEEWPRFWSLVQIFGTGNADADNHVRYGTAFVTQQDGFAIAFDREQLKERLKRFLKKDATFKELDQEFSFCSTNQWDYARAREELKSISIDRDATLIAYRPFDSRFTVLDRNIATIPRERISRQFFQPNVALLTTRRITAPPYDTVFATSQVPEYKIASYDRNSIVFPVWLYTSSSDRDRVLVNEDLNSSLSDRTANFAPTLVESLHSSLQILERDYRPEDLTAPLHAEKIFHYLYAVLHSPAYRLRYAAFLRTDFPRIPIPGSRKVFDALVKLGAELVAWHLLVHQDAISIVAGNALSARAAAWFGTDFSLVRVAEKSRELADVQGTDDKVGKVFINATSGFANVHQSIWQHTIGGYQVLHKWLDDRRKAGRSLSQDDITHWLRVYAALQATQKLMLKVDEVIEANGGWPGAFSQNHPPPDAATLAAEQMVQKEQLKTQKKAATATKKRAAYASPTGASSLFDDLEDMAGAAGGPDRPKSRATPAKAAGGKASGSAVQVNGLNDGQLMCAIRRVLASAGIGGFSRDDLIRSTARELGHARTSPALMVELDAAIRRAVRRGIAGNSGGVLTVLVKDIDGYDRDHLKAQLLAAIRAAGGSCAKADAPTLLARALGFARTGAGIAAVVESLLRSLVRTKQVESRAGQIRVVRAGVAV